MPAGEIVIVPFHDAGHVFPARELAGLLASRDYLVTLLLPSSSSSSSPCASLHPLIRVVEFKHFHGLPPPPPSHRPGPGPGPGPEAHIRDLFCRVVRDRAPSSPPLLCVVVDVMMGRLLMLCRELGVPAACLFTASACSAAFEHAMACISRGGGALAVPGFLGEMDLTVAELVYRGPPGPGRHGRPPPHGHGRAPPRKLLSEMDGAVALLFNTCDDLERTFLDYIAREAKKPAWAVGPLLPAQFWSGTPRSLVHDDTVRPKRDSSHSERDVIEWLDSKPPRSVVYVCFGSLVSPTEPELAELAAGLEESNRAFLWAMRHDTPDPPDGPTDLDMFDPDEFAKCVGERGLVIRGWAPQLLILSHPSAGAFLTHCGWNSTVEALACGVPMLAWPSHGDQVHNARLVTRQLHAGHEIKSGSQDAVNRNDIAKGIEKLMTDKETSETAATVARDVFGDGFPRGSSASLDAFLDLIDATRNDH